MKPHPSFATLSRYAAGELPAPKRARVAAHLAHCPRCRETLSERRALAGALRDLPAPGLPDGAFDRIAARRAAGDRVVLPAAEPAAAPRRRRLPAVAAAVATLAAAAFLALRAPEAGADASALRVLTEHPRPGEEITVEYRATARLAGEERLAVRARLVTAEWRAVPRYARLGELRRSGPSTFRGSFLLPDSVVYAALAVESVDGSRVDHDPAGWAVRAHGADGRPLLAALQGEIDVRLEWNTATALETAREMARLYPDSIAAWSRLFDRETETADRARADSLRSAHLARLRALERRVEAAPTPGEMSALASYAGALDDTAAERRWVDRLVTAHPRAPAAVRWRGWRALDAHRGDAAGALAALERLWAEAGPAAATELAFPALQFARQANDAGAVQRWGERLERTSPELAPMLARAFSEQPALRARAMERLRERIRALDAAPALDRPLGYTVEQQRRALGHARGYFLGQLGKALLAEGRTAAALDTLERATRAAWNPELFRAVADTRLQAGDTAGAAPVLARVAVDPATPPAFADSARARLGARFDRPAWEREVRSARAEMRAGVMAAALSRPLRGKMRFADASGRVETFPAESEGPTLVAFWSRFCPPSVMQMGELEAVSRRLRARGVRVVAVTSEAPSPALDAYLREKGVTLPVAFDPDGEAGRAFENRGTPRYFVLDAAGRIRFEGHAVGEAERQVAVLRGETGTGDR